MNISTRFCYAQYAQNHAQYPQYRAQYVQNNMLNILRTKNAQNVPTIMPTNAHDYAVIV